MVCTLNAMCDIMRVMLEMMIGGVVCVGCGMSIGETKG